MDRIPVVTVKARRTKGMIRPARCDYKPLVDKISTLREGTALRVRMPGTPSSARVRLAQVVAISNQGKSRGSRGWLVLHMKNGDAMGLLERLGKAAA